MNYGQCVQTPKAITLSPYEPEPVEPIVRNLNIGFAVDFQSKSDNPLNPLRQLDNMEIEKLQLESRTPGKNVSVQLDPQVLHNSQVFDTFEQCLHISNQMESVMAYYYKDEDNPRCYNFQEIYDIDEVDMDIPSPTKNLDDLDQDLSWDDYLEVKPELETEVEDLIQEVLSMPNFAEPQSQSS